MSKNFKELSEDLLRKYAFFVFFLFISVITLIFKDYEIFFFSSILTIYFLVKVLELKLKRKLVGNKLTYINNNLYTLMNNFNIKTSNKDKNNNYQNENENKFENKKESKKENYSYNYNYNDDRNIKDIYEDFKYELNLLDFEYVPKFKECKSMYLQKIKECHPDVGGDPEMALELNEAFQRLSQELYFNK